MRQQAKYLTSHSRPAPPGDPSATPGPRKRALAEAEATDLRQTKRPAIGRPAGTASVDIPPVNPGSAPSASAPRKKGHNAHKIAELAKEYKENEPQSTYQFDKENAMKMFFQNNKKILNALGIQHAYLVNEVLLACEKAVGGSPADGEYNLPIERNGHTAHVFWKIKDHQTALLTIAPNAERLKEKVARIKKAEAGKQAKPLARAGMISDTHARGIFIIKKQLGNASILTELGYAPEEHTTAVRALSLHCDTVLRNAQRAGGAAQDGDRVSSTDIEDVQHFNFTRFGPLGKNVEGLRWVSGNTLHRLQLFKEGGLDDALKAMQKGVASRQSQDNENQISAPRPAGTHEQNPYGIPAGGQAAFPAGASYGEPQEWTAPMPPMHMQGHQGFIADPEQMPYAAPLVSPPLMQQQLGYPAPDFFQAPLPIITEQAAYSMQAFHPLTQPGNPSAALGPEPNNHALAQVQATDLRRTKHPWASGPTGTASGHDRGE